MEKLSRQLEYFITSAVLLGVGLLFYLLNTAVNSVTMLHFSLFQVLQSIPLLLCGVLRWYGDYVAARLNGQPEANQEEQESEQDPRKDARDSVHAVMGILVVAVLVVGYYMLTMKVKSDGTGLVAPLHLVICVVDFIIYACLERWWSLRLADDADAAGVCNLMVLNKAAVLALTVDLLGCFTGLFGVTVFVDYFLLALWVYVSVLCVLSVAWKLIRHSQALEFHLYILLPVYYANGKGSGALDWLERNTGISMRSLWSLKFIKTVLPSCCFAVIMLLWLSTCVVQVEAYQQGALYRFGRLAQADILDAGLHFKLPVPFETVSLYDVQHPQSMIVGYEGDVTSRNNLWTRPHEGEEQTLLLGNGKELVAINLKVTYRINDLYAYLTNFSSPEQVLNAKGYEIVMNETVNTNIDALISTDRSVLSHRIEQRLKDYAQAERLGLEVMSVTLASIHPPVDIADVYQSVVSADTQSKTTILVAEGEALVAREQAEAQRQTAIQNANIQRSQRVAAARAETDEYNASIEAYLMDPEAYLLDKYLESFEAAMAGRRKYIVGPGVDIGALYGDFGSRTRSAWFAGVSGQGGAGEGN